MSEFKHQFVRARSVCGYDADEIMAGEYDMLLTSSSWDSRCVCLAQSSGLQAQYGMLLLFDQRDSQGLRDEHDKVLCDYLEKACDQLCLVEGPSVGVNEIWKKLSHALLRIKSIVGRPLRIAVDISTCPRFYYGGMVAVGVAGGIAERVDAFYSEGKYPDKNEDAEIAFTGGRWSTVTVPGLNGVHHPGKRRFYLVSAGFEGGKTLRAVNIADPDRVSILFPDPGIEDDYVRRAWDANSELIAHYRVPPHQIVSAHAGDAVAAWRAVTEGGIERPMLENSFYILSGSKPHSLGLMLRAVVNGEACVLYNLPEEHRVVDVASNGVFWRYEIENATAIA